MGRNLMDVTTAFTLERALARLDDLMALADNPAAASKGDQEPRHA
jgi:hypothetical protein